MKSRKATLWVYFDGKEHCDLVQWALASNMMIGEAKKCFVKNYPLHKVTFKTR